MHRCGEERIGRSIGRVWFENERSQLSSIAKVRLYILIIANIYFLELLQLVGSAREYSVVLIPDPADHFPEDTARSNICLSIQKLSSSLKDPNHLYPLSQMSRI